MNRPFIYFVSLSLVMGLVVYFLLFIIEFEPSPLAETGVMDLRDHDFSEGNIQQYSESDDECRRDLLLRYIKSCSLDQDVLRVEYLHKLRAEIQLNVIRGRSKRQTTSLMKFFKNDKHTITMLYELNKVPTISRVFNSEGAWYEKRKHSAQKRWEELLKLQRGTIHSA